MLPRNLWVGVLVPGGDKALAPGERWLLPRLIDNGHTWHDPFEVLFGITKDGLVPSYAPKDSASDMPGFEGTLGDRQIWAVLAYIRSQWSPRIRAAHTSLQGQADAR